MAVPTWVQDAIFYQIFPDRFENGNPRINPPNVKPWGSIPTSNGFQGGDIQGIVNRLDYLKDLGINAIYLNPIFLSPSTHRYNTTDYFMIDPKLGTIDDFRNLLKQAHKRHIRVILDGVFNHCGRGFFAFSDILENQDHSPYRDWFFIRKFPIDAYSHGDAADYLGWWKHKSLPKLNTYNPFVRRYILDVARHWVDEGIDGWRLDVPNEIDDDDFWAEFRAVVKTANPEAYLLGEIWTIDPRWIGKSHFDGLMNYPVRTAIIDALMGKIQANEFLSQINRDIHAYPCENTNAMYNLLGSHDTERILTMLNNDVQKLKQAMLISFTLPGAPAIYYGDEIGLTGGKDPDCRKAFPWDEAKWNIEIQDWVQKLTDLRQSSIGLRRGSYHQLVIENQMNCAGYIRESQKEKIIVLVNFGDSTGTALINLEKNFINKNNRFKNMLDGKEIKSDENVLNLTLPKKSSVILKEIEN
jgi:glycosidase